MTRLALALSLALSLQPSLGHGENKAPSICEALVAKGEVPLHHLQPTVRDATHARAIIADGISFEKFRLAIAYIRAQRYASAQSLIGDFDLLYKAIQDTTDGFWLYRKIKGKDGSVIYLGKSGPATVVTMSGDVYGGRLADHLYDEVNEWLPNYSKLDFIMNPVQQ